MTTCSPTDLAALWERYFAEGKPESIRNELVVEYRRHAEIVVRSWLKRRSSAGDIDFDDVVQDALMKVMQCVESYDPSRGTKFETFVGNAIRNKCTDYLRGRGVRRSHVVSETDAELLCGDEADHRFASAEDVAVGNETRRRAFASLSGDLLTTAKMALIEGRTKTEIAKRLGVSSATAWRRVDQMLSIVRDALPEYAT